MKKYIIIYLIACANLCYAQTKPATIKTSKSKFASLAIDKQKGFYYGWAYDYDSQKEAEEKALEECKKKGGNCAIVLTFSGEGCAVYRTSKSSEGTAYGWGVGKTKLEADAIAMSEFKKRSKGNVVTNNVWACNSTTSAQLKEIINAKDEISGAQITRIGSSQSVCFSSDGKKLAIAGGDGKIRILSVPTYTLLLVIDVASRDYFKEVMQVSFSPDNKFIASGHGRGGKVNFWNATSGKFVKAFDTNWKDSPAYSFSPNGKLFVSGGGCPDESTCKINVWDFATGNLLHSLTVPDFNISSTSFSPDGKILATTGRDGTVVFWNPIAGSKITSFTANKSDQLREGIFSPDGKTFATLSWDGDKKAKIWNVENAKNIISLPSLVSFGYATAFYEGGTKLLTTDYHENMFL